MVGTIGQLCIFTVTQTSKRLDLSTYRSPNIPGNRGFLWRVVWYLINTLVYQSRLPLLPSSVKALILRAFGAKIGRGLVIKPRVNIKYPWFLTVGNHVWIGEEVWIDNPGSVLIGDHVCISQGAYLVTGNHDYLDPEFGFFSQPIIVGAGTWISAQATIPPGSKIPNHTVMPIAGRWSNKHQQEDV